MDPRAVVRALTEIAETASETLELQQVFERLASSLRELIPFDHMGVVRLLDFEIVRDLKAELAPGTERNKALVATGMRSWLRVPVLLWGEVHGALGVLHREPARYTAEDVEVARRLADRIALVMS